MLKILKFTNIKINFFLSSRFTRQCYHMNKKLLDCYQRNQLIEVYENEKSKFDFINYNIFLKKIVKFNSDQKIQLSEKQQPKYVIDSVNILCENLRRLNNLTLFSFLAICINNNFPIEFSLFEKQIKLRLFALELNELNIIMKAIHTLKISNDELINQIQKRVMNLINNDQDIQIKQVYDIFINLNRYRLISNQNNKKLISIISTNLNDFTLNKINYIFKVIVIDPFQIDLKPFFDFLENKSKFSSLKSTLNLLNNMATLGQKNEIVIDNIIKLIKLKAIRNEKNQDVQEQEQKIQIENQQSKINKIQIQKYLINEVSPSDFGQMLASLIKLNRYQFYILQIIQANILKKIHQCPYQDLIIYLANHNHICTKLIQNSQISTDQVKINKIRKYHHQFYHYIFQNLAKSKKLNWLQFLEILKISSDKPNFTNKTLFDLILNTALTFLQNVLPNNAFEEQKFRQYINLIKKYQRKQEKQVIFKLDLSNNFQKKQIFNDLSRLCVITRTNNK